MFFYQPKDAWAADFIPLYAKKAFYLFYLKDWRNPSVRGEGTPWYLLRTNNLVDFEEIGEALGRGNADEQDLYVFTGSALEAEGAYHIFYTGHNPHFIERGRKQEAVMHAVSNDLIHWDKCPRDTFCAPEGYEPHDWRDPFVYRDERDNCYYMLLAARLDEGDFRRRGITACMKSNDLLEWEKCEPFWNPQLYYTHECPDYFAMGDFEYMLFSEYSSESVTRYVMRRKGENTWQIPEDDRLDGRGWYAAKTASDGEKRYAFGWIATRDGDSDEGNWQWGGCLNIHEVYAVPDGSLRVREPKSTTDAFTNTLWSISDATVVAPGKRTELVLGQTNDTYRLEMHFCTSDDVRTFSLLLNADEALSSCHELCIDLDKKRMSLECWQRLACLSDVPGIERPLHRWTRKEHVLTVIVDGTAACAYLDNEIAMSFRMYRKPGTTVGIACKNGTATVSSVKVTTLPC